MTPAAITSAGALVGTTAAGIESFRGVRYAMADRFAAPQPVTPWEGVALATQPGPAAPQLASADDLVPDMAVAEIGEDCLRAEIWTPSTRGHRPVLVWVPGGRYQIGSASLATYDGSRLASEGDIVVIGLNYRLGALGFLATEGVPGNLGLRDLIAALRWIRSEAAAFGGDPDNITLMGESAGAGAIAHLLASPAARGLFDGAILQSGTPGATLERATAETVTAAFLRAAGTDRIEHVRTFDLDRLLAAQRSADAELLASVGMMPFHPFVDDEIVVAGPLHTELAPVPLVIGTTADEMALFRDQIPALPEEYAVPFLARQCAAFADDADAAARRGLAACAGDLAEAIADTDLHVPAHLLADRHAARDLPVWRYRFAWPAPRIGAAHATDLPFTFGNLDVANWRAFLGADGDRADLAETLSGAMRQAWAEFCHTKAPACAPIGAWPRHDATRRATVLGEHIRVTPDLGGERFRAWTGTA